MSASPTKSVFINYRRRNNSAIPFWLSETIARTYGDDSVFIDTGYIPMGVKWKEVIDQALERASVLIVVIDPEWLTVSDEYGNRLISKTNDWVRYEIKHAITHGRRIIPLLISGAALPALEGLPPVIRPLLDHQAFKVRDDNWRDDFMGVLDRLEQIGFKRTGTFIEYPPVGKNDPPLTHEEIQENLNSLPGWELDKTRTGLRGDRRIELKRTFIFNSFEDAMHFMMAATRHITKVNHHPDWENIWRTITVWLTTWDIGHKPSIHDINLAKYLEKLYEDYDPGKKHDRS